MKKNRLNIILNAVARQRDETRLANLIPSETTNLRFNLHALDHRHDAKIRIIEINGELSAIPVRQRFVQGKPIQSKPEYEVMADIAASRQLNMDELNHKILLQLDPIPGRKK